MRSYSNQRKKIMMYGIPPISSEREEDYDEDDSAKSDDESDADDSDDN